MANQNQNQNQAQTRSMQNRQQGRNTQTQMTNRQDQPQGNGQTYYSYSYGYGYYDPYTGDWVMDYYGPFTGVGPSGYQRSDDRISDDICDLLWLNGNIDASDVDVEVKNGEATLKGTVPNRQMKRLAEDLAYAVPGVSDVQNQLRVQKQNQQLGQGQAQGQRQMGAGQHNWQSQLKQGMDVTGSQGKKVGTVKEIHNNDILIDRPMALDVHVPFSAIQNVSDNTVTLNVPADQVDNMHWATSAKQTAAAR